LQFENNCNVSENYVKGKLKESIEFWTQEIQANDDIISVIKNGFVLPFIAKPPFFIMKNNRSALENAAFVETAINDLLVKNCAYEVPFVPHNVNPLSVAINASGKKRLILEVSVLNTFIKEEKVKFEEYKVAK